MEDDPEKRFEAPHFVALGYLTDATAYRNAALSLDTDSKNVPMFGPIYFLSCHAMELLLKACIIARTGSIEGLRAHKVRHNLEKLKKLAVEAGLQLSIHSDAVTAMLAPYHADQSFRYRRSGYKTLPLTTEVHKAVDEIMSSVAPIVHRTVRQLIGR